MRDFCPFCASVERRQYAEEQSYRDQPQISAPFYTCSDCGTIYPGHRLDFSEIRQYIDVMERSIPADYVPDYNIPWYDFTLQILPQLKKEFGIKTALDIGANNGKFCLQLEKAGISATGIEPQELLVKMAQMRGLNVLSGIYPDEIPASEKRSVYDLVSMNEVVYYFPDIKKTFAVTYDHLNDKGILYIQSYLGDNDARRYNKSFFARPGDYLQAFPTIKTLRYWLEESGFEILKVIPVPDEYFSILTGIGAEKCRIVQRLINMFIGRLTPAFPSFWLNRVDRIIIVAMKDPNRFRNHFK